MSVTFLTDKDGVAVTCTSSGNLITVNDAATMPLQGLHIYGKTTQDGTPSPDAPMELVSAGDDGSIGVTVYGKNLFDKNKYTASMLFVDTAINAFTDAGDFRSVIIPIAPGTMYTVSKSTATIMRVGTSVRYPEAGAAMTKFANHSAASTAPLTVTSGDSDRWMLVQLFANSDLSGGYGSIAANIGSLMVEAGSVATEYEPCTVQSLTLSTPNGLPGIPVASGGNYTDANGQQWVCDEIDLERGVYVQRITKKRLTSSSHNWAASASLAGRYLFNYSHSKGVTPLCSHFAGANTATTNVNEVCSNNGQQILFNTTFTTVEEWKAWLNANEVWLVYPAVSITETALTGDEIAAYTALHTNKSNTTVLNDSGAGMKLDYMADTKTYIDNKFAELAAAMVSNT